MTDEISRYLLVRVKNFNPRKGYKTRRYTYKGRRFDIDDGWHEIPRLFAEEMRDLKNDEGLKIFDVVELGVAQELDDTEDAPTGTQARDADHAGRVLPSQFKRHDEMEKAKDKGDADPMDMDAKFFRSAKDDRELDDVFDPANDDDDEPVDEPVEKSRSAKRATSRKAKKRSRKSAKVD